MPEREFELKQIGVDYVCDECGQGTMEQHGQVAWLSEPLQFPHKCNKCGAEKALTEKYPTVRFVRVTS